MKTKCPKCGKMMPYIPDKGWICLNCGNTDPYKKRRNFENGQL